MPANLAPPPQGMLKGDVLSKAYASGDVFVMPSETETLGFVVLEAMASGLPVVAVAAGGLTDIITEPGKTGLLYQVGDYKGALAGRCSLSYYIRSRCGSRGTSVAQFSLWTMLRAFSFWRVWCTGTGT